MIDPHGAVGYLALQDYLSGEKEKYNSIILETAHPAKFKDVVEESLNVKVEIPGRLAESMSKEKKSIKLSNNFDDFKDYLLSL